MTEHIRDKILRLLAKAEATPFEPEALAFAAKAQELITQYAIDVASLDAEEARRVGHSELLIEDPYASARFALLSAVALPSRCQAVWSRYDGLAHLFGTDHDRSHVELLYTSLLLQATNAMTARGSVVDANGRNRTRSYRQAFLVGYAGEVGRRLHTASEAVVADAAPGVHPVLATSEREVDEELRRRFPHLRTHRPSVSSGAGLREGLDAGRRADLGTPRFRPDGHRGSLRPRGNDRHR
jgi:hypothetical protein